MQRRCVLAGLAGLAVFGRGQAMARDLVGNPEVPWRYLSDQVMGGMSEGRAERHDGALRLVGIVSTENRGGFIQVRTDLRTALPADARAIALEARGNSERYFVHLRTRGTRLPWQYYRAGFDTGPDWRRIELPFTAFAASGRMLPGVPEPDRVTSIGLVAFGRAHRAELELRRLEVI